MFPPAPPRTASASGAPVTGAGLTRENTSVGAGATTTGQRAAAVPDGGAAVDDDGGAGVPGDGSTAP